MFSDESSYYAEISILVDGWPWNLSEFDFRRWFAPGSCPQALMPDNIAPEIAAQAAPARIPATSSENRRVAERRRRRERRHQKAA